MKKSDSLAKYIKLRDQLLSERNDVEQRLKQLNIALGQMNSVSIADAAESRKKTRRPRSALSLRSAVTQVTEKVARTKPEILEAVEKLGYKFAGKNPINSIGVILYGKPKHFKNENGKFSYVGPATASSVGDVSGPANSKHKSGKRKGKRAAHTAAQS
jgi:hypothetical protein